MTDFTDSHAHIYLDKFKNDRDEVLGRAIEENVTKIFMPNIDYETIDQMLELEEAYPENCFSMMGLHPCSVKNDFEKELYIVEEWLAKRKFYAVGEMGTDLYWDKTYWEQQKEAFKIQVDLAIKHSLPIVIHCRESIDETIALVEELKTDKLTGVFHCFTGTKEQAQRIENLDFYLGLGGVSTFKNGGMDKVVPEISLDKVILETDSPYLTPEPKRGKRNEPSFIPHIARKIASFKQIGLDEVAQKTTENSLRLFKFDEIYKG